MISDEQLRELCIHCIPDTWTHERNLNTLQIGFKAKLLGINWTSINMLAKVLTLATHRGFVEIDTSNPHATMVRRTRNCEKTPGL